jgi:hypothetical protein
MLFDKFPRFIHFGRWDMKQFCYLVVLGIVVLIMSPSVSKGADVSVGATAWYAEWLLRPTSTSNNNGGGTPKTTMGPEWMVGPALSVRFAQNWTLGEVFLYSATKYDMSSSGGGPGKLSRTDSDTTLNYNINRYFKIFPGVKYMRFSYTGGHHQSVGPGFGVGATLPLTDNLFVIVNGSGSYLFGDHKDQGASSVGFREYGYNTTAGLAYYVESISTTINIGYRYQFFHTKFDNHNSGNDDLDHTFRGFNMSVIYSF